MFDFERFDEPYAHFISKGGSLPQKVAEELYDICPLGDLASPTGSRADYKNRMFLKRDSQDGYSDALKEFLQVIDSESFREKVEQLTGTSVQGCDLRLELVGDVNGFYQIPHTDTSDKKLTWLTYLGSVEENGDVGTAIFDTSENLLFKAPWGFNNGLVFVPADNTYHGFSQGQYIKGVRKVLIINYVVGWNGTHELYK